MTSPDGITWTGQSSPGVPTLTTIAYGNDTFVITTSSDTLLYSLTGTNNSWVLVNFPFKIVKTVTFANGYFVAICTNEDKAAAVSSDGITWDFKKTNTSTEEFNDIYYGNGLFIATSLTGTFHTLNSLKVL
jgi:hypothetical protein